MLGQAKIPPVVHKRCKFVFLRAITSGRLNQLILEHLLDKQSSYLIHLCLNKSHTFDEVSVQFSCSVLSYSLWPPWTATCQVSLSITNSQSLFNMSIESIPSPPTFNLSQHQCVFQLISSLHQVAKVLDFPASALELPPNIQDWFPLGWTGWISLQSKGLSRVFSNTTVQKHQFFST